MRVYRVTERNLSGTVYHESYRNRNAAEHAAAERANLLSDNSPIEIGVKAVYVR